MGNDTIDKKYGVPLSEISCPSCGQRYGHHNTQVDVNSQECSSCVKQYKYKDVEFVSGAEFIEKYCGYSPLSG